MTTANLSQLLLWLQVGLHTLKSNLARCHPFSPQPNFWDKILLISDYNRDVGVRILEQPCGQRRVVRAQQKLAVPSHNFDKESEWTTNV
jgi:hypothetical protein